MSVHDIVYITPKPPVCSTHNQHTTPARLFVDVDGTAAAAASSQSIIILVKQFCALHCVGECVCFVCPTALRKEYSDKAYAWLLVYSTLFLYMRIFAHLYVLRFFVQYARKLKRDDCKGYDRSPHRHILSSVAKHNYC